ncbi:MAG TPA: hydroxymethylbilane synthase [Candidatus Acidoferrales bacterium]|nr:hydroxymethylbilane synthase [Candidatus Acidoferrales bacterium]
MKLVRIGTRGSALARWQAEFVRAGLASHGVDAELVIIRTSGDRDAQTSLRVIGGKGVFTKELEEALLDGRIDLAVHSMKDMPTTVPGGLEIAAICEREDVHDALISREGVKLDQLRSGARMGTSSLRRQAQLRHYRRDLEMLDMRGNVDTRLAKLARGDYDAIVLAKAGLDRLARAGQITEVIAPEICLPAAGQGAIGIEMRSGEAELAGAVQKLNHPPSKIAVDAERAVLRGLESGCQVPIGVWARIEDDRLHIDACVLSPDGSEVIRETRTGSSESARNMGESTARALLERGAGRLLRLAERGVEHR